LSSLILGSKYPINYAASNSSSSTSISEGYLANTDLELITLKIIDLSVNLRRGKLIKEVLLHLRGALQAVHVLSFEAILRALHSAAEQKVDEAQLKVPVVQDLLASLDLDDEFCGASSSLAENNSAVWFRFYWEILRVILDISRNNSRLELVYHDTVLKAFQFCRRFSRRDEFRRLSEMVRYHLALSVKYPGQVNAIPLASSASSHQLALELRFAQLALACDMELWQEAFRTVEDIYGLQLLARKSVRQLTAPEYFDRLARIFAKSDNFLFLAATLMRQPSLQEGQAEVSLMASLAIPFESSVDVSHSERLAQIIGLSSVPTRASLLAAIERRGLTSSMTAHPALVTIHGLLKSTSMQVDSDVSVGVNALKDLSSVAAFKPFIRGCYENLLTLQVRSVLKDFDSISLKDLASRACLDFAISSCLVPKFNLELFLLRSFKGIKINHVSGMLLIDRSVLLSNPVPLCGTTDDSGLVWSQLQREMTKLLEEGGALMKKTPCDNLIAKLKAEHEANLERRVLIERRKELLEAAATEKERKESRERALKAQKEAETERARQAEEIARRDRERLELERAEIRRLEAEKRAAEQEKMKEAAGLRMNREKIAAQATRLDYLERALRAEEIPLLEADYSHQKESDRAAYDSRCKLISELAAGKHARDLEMKKRLLESPVFSEDFESFFEAARSRRQQDLLVRQTQAEIDLAAEKEKRRARIAAEMEARRKIEAEREIARASIFDAPSALAVASSPVISESSTSGKYVPPSRAGSSAWRREVPVESVNSAPAAPVTPAATPVEKAVEKAAYVPRHKRNA